MQGRQLLTFAYAILLAGTVALPANAKVVPGTPVWHNGTADSSPSGTGEVDVRFQYGLLGPHAASYYATATHTVQYTYAPGPSTVLWAHAFFANSSGVPWTGFRILLEGADFAGFDYDDPVAARPTNPLVDIGFYNDGTSILATEEIGLQHWILQQNTFSLVGSSITRFNDQGSGFRDSLLEIQFDDPVQSGRTFVLHYNIIPSPGAAGAPDFTAYFTPVPEPATLALLSVAATGWLVRHRR